MAKSSRKRQVIHFMGGIVIPAQQRFLQTTPKQMIFGISNIIFYLSGDLSF